MRLPGGVSSGLAALLIATLMLGAASGLPEEVIAALIADHEAPTTMPTPTPPPEAIGDHPDKNQKKHFPHRIYKTKVIDLPSRGLQITLLPWKCFNQSNCKSEPACTTSGGTTKCTTECYACNSCVQPKIIKRRQKDGKIKVTRRSYIRTHSCGTCYSHSECSADPSSASACPKPRPCELSKG